MIDVSECILLIGAALSFAKNTVIYAVTVMVDDVDGNIRCC